MPQASSEFGAQSSAPLLNPPTLENASSLLFGSIAQKLIVFTLNQYVLIHCKPELFGQVAIKWELWLSMSLFLSRESIRMACLRSNLSHNSHQELQAIVNISWLPILFITLLSLVAHLALHLLYEMDRESSTMFVLCCIASFIECLGEPFYNLGQSRGLIRPRIVAESGALVVKSGTTFICARFLDLGVYSFGTAQIGYAIAFVLLLMGNSTRDIAWTNNAVSVCPAPITIRPPSPADSIISSPPTTISSDIQQKQQHKTGHKNVESILCINVYLQSSLLESSRTMLWQMVVKQLVTEGDKIALTLLANAGQQGYYALVNNYTSLLARVVFLPLEDAGRLSFSKLAAQFRAHGAIDSFADSKGDGKMLHDILFAQLRGLLRCVVYLGTIAAVFGPFYFPLLLQQLLPAHWHTGHTYAYVEASSLSFLTTLYSIFLLILAVNGITEAFVQSVSPDRLLYTQSISLFGSSVCFIASILITTPAANGIDGAGVVAANMAAMLVRIIFNFYMIELFYSHPHTLLKHKMSVTDTDTNKAGKIGYFFLTLFTTHALYILLILFFAILSLSFSQYAYSISFYSSTLLLYIPSLSHKKGLVVILDLAGHILVGAFIGLSFLIISYLLLLDEEEQKYLGKIRKRWFENRKETKRGEEGVKVE